MPLGPQNDTVIVRRAVCKKTAHELGSGIQFFSELPSDKNLLKSVRDMRQLKPLSLMHCARVLNRQSFPLARFMTLY